MISTQDIDAIIGAEAVDDDNDRIGKVGQVYVDSDSDQPTWVSVRSGLFGTAETLVPLAGANWDRDALHLAFSKDRVKDAPRIDTDSELSPEEQQRLYEYYGVEGMTGADDAPKSDAGSTSTAAAGNGMPRDDDSLDADDHVTRAPVDSRTDAGADVTGGAAGSSDRGRTANDFDEGGMTGRGDGFAAGHDTSGPNTDDAMTRSEERLNVGTERVEAGTARLRKYVVTEQQTVTVPVSHDEVRVEREPITDANRGAATDGPQLSDEEHEVVLTEERPVVAKETVPVERVRLGTETVTEDREVTEDVRHEEIETDDGAGGHAAR